jgi:hypothetical protein
MEDTAMTSIIEKTLNEIFALEKATVLPNNVKYSKYNAASNKADIEVDVDSSDEQNIDESDNIFSAFNQTTNTNSLRVDVQIDEDIEEEEGDSIAESGDETVFDQGTKLKSEDETYLNLLKKQRTSRVKVKVKR